MKITFYRIMLGIVIVVSGCKPKTAEKSELRTIDTLLQDKDIKDRAARCGPLESKMEEFTKKSEFNEMFERTYNLSVASPMTEADARRLLVTIPKLVYQHVIKNATISFVGNSEQLCAKKLKSLGLFRAETEAQLTDLRSCWYQESGQPANLVLPADWGLASRAILPVAGEAFLGVFSGRRIKAGRETGALTAKEFNFAVDLSNDLKETLAGLGKAMIKDIKSADIDEKVKAKLLERYNNRFSLKTESDRRYREFGRIVFTETFDSYYCSPVSQSTLELPKPKGQYTHTWDLFKPIATTLGESWIKVAYEK